MESCLENCRLGRRCLSRATLVKIAEEQRLWDGIPHVTNLLNGTMEEFLKVVENYSISPRSLAYALLGTAHHSGLEQYAGFLSEVGLILGSPSDPLIQGTADLFEVDEFDPDCYILTDYKTWGSYKVGQALGVTRGITKGQWHLDPDRADIREVQLQTNMYRIMAEQQLGIKVSRIQVQVTVRDGGTYIARDRGIFEPMYMIDIPLLEDGSTMLWFLTKRVKLLDALDQGAVPDVCTYEERWEDRKCKDYCVVAPFCPHGLQVLARSK